MVGQVEGKPKVKVVKADQEVVASCTSVAHQHGGLLASRFSAHIMIYPNTLDPCSMQHSVSLMMPGLAIFAMFRVAKSRYKVQ